MLKHKWFYSTDQIEFPIYLEYFRKSQPFWYQPSFILLNIIEDPQRAIVYMGYIYHIRSYNRKSLKIYI